MSCFKVLGLSSWVFFSSKVKLVLINFSLDLVPWCHHNNTDESLSSLPSICCEYMGMMGSTFTGAMMPTMYVNKKRKNSVSHYWLRLDFYFSFYKDIRMVCYYCYGENVKLYILMSFNHGCIVQELKEAFNAEVTECDKLMVTATVSPERKTVKVSYDVPAIAK